MTVERYPKLHSPLVREERDGGYFVADEVQEGHEWVFEKADQDHVIATEKLDGTNISVLYESGDEINHPGKFQIWARAGQAPMNYYSLLEKNNTYIVDGVLEAWRRGWIEEYAEDGEPLYGELIGERVKGNPYDIDGNLFVPFEYLKDKCSYHTYGKYDTGYEEFKTWFDEGLIPLFYARWHGVDFDRAAEHCQPEGVVFHNLKTGEKSKLRYDMFNFE